MQPTPLRKESFSAAPPRPLRRSGALEAGFWPVREIAVAHDIGAPVRSFSRSARRTCATCRRAARGALSAVPSSTSSSSLNEVIARPANGQLPSGPRAAAQGRPAVADRRDEDAGSVRFEKDAPHVGILVQVLDGAMSPRDDDGIVAAAIDVGEDERAGPHQSRRPPRVASNFRLSATSS